jgi:hypothetical protein
MKNSNVILGIGSGIGKELFKHFLNRNEYTIGISSKKLISKEMQTRLSVKLTQFIKIYTN